ncbi:hypothetical protein A2U01_0067927, partial [Trifolium medium]|nr:hypothetical protein [Trifolium medium]
ARVRDYRSTWKGNSKAVDPSRIVGSWSRAGALARYAEQKGIWASLWPSPEQVG